MASVIGSPSGEARCFAAGGTGRTDGVERREQMSAADLWTYRDTSIGTRDLSGFNVEAMDGSIGKIDEASNELGASYLVVDTGPWIFGKKVLLPAGVIDRVDVDDETVFVNRTKDEIKSAPEFDEARYRDPAYRDELGGYYGQGGAGYRDVP
jgi:hypothetical protein